MTFFLFAVFFFLPPSSLLGCLASDVSSVEEDLGSVKAQYLFQHIPTKDMASSIESALEGQLKVLVAAVQDEEIRRAAINLLKARMVRTKQN